MINPEWVNAPFAIGIKRERSGFEGNYAYHPIIYQRQMAIAEESIAQNPYEREVYDHLDKNISPLQNKDSPRILPDGRVVNKYI